MPAPEGLCFLGVAVARQDTLLIHTWLMGHHVPSVWIFLSAVCSPPQFLKIIISAVMRAGPGTEERHGYLMGEGRREQRCP